MVVRSACSKHAALFNPPTSTSTLIAQQWLSIPRRHQNHYQPLYQSASFSSTRTRSFPPSPPSSSSSEKNLSSNSTSSPLANPSALASSSSSASSTELSPSVNPPISTLPAELELPSKEELGGGPKYYFQLGKGYLKFYKTGLKHVVLNYRSSIPLRERLGLPTKLPVSPWTDKPSSTGKSSPSEGLTRSDFQLVRRSAHDVRRTIPFALILLICGEFTPFVVLALGNKVTPITCRVPTQFDKTRMQRIQHKEAALSTCAESQGLMGSEPQQVRTLSTLLRDGGAAADKLSAEDVMRLCVVFGLTKSMTPPALAVPGFLKEAVVNQFYKPKLRKWLDYLEADDRLIVSGGGSKGMSEVEVRMAVDERGGVDCWPAMKHGSVSERAWLDAWLKGRA